jgi:sterol desaturase/sphingolipid hydroxylase (fatty acid hydroxylase superfamily)
MPWALFHSTLGLIAPMLMMLAIIAGGVLIERLAPAEPAQPSHHTMFNVAHAIAVGWIRVGVGPLLGIVVTIFVNRSGGGWIVLPDSGWRLALSAVLYLLAIDFVEFAFHRAQHAIPFLWAMHSFHHSDTSVNVSTATRNHWLEMPIKTLFVYPLVAIVFRVPSTVLLIYAVTTVWHSVNHLNVRWRIPIPWFVLNNPQFHRIHHSSLPEHWDTNFSPYFPIWDLIGGTAYVPGRDEYPPTGLPGEAAPTSLTHALLWPWRRRLAHARTAPGDAILPAE